MNGYQLENNRVKSWRPVLGLCVPLKFTKPLQLQVTMVESNFRLSNSHQLTRRARPFAFGIMSKAIQTGDYPNLQGRLVLRESHSKVHNYASEANNPSFNPQ
jgi:hypothetical protein